MERLKAFHTDYGTIDTQINGTELTITIRVNTRSNRGDGVLIDQLEKELRDSAKRVCRAYHQRQSPKPKPKQKRPGRQKKSIPAPPVPDETPGKLEDLFISTEEYKALKGTEN